MRVSVQSLPDHLPNPFIKQYNETSAERYAWLIEMASIAEQNGFWGFWVGEHHAVSRYLVPSPHVVLAAMAARTSRIKLGAGVVVLPLCTPVRVAEDYAVLDQIAKGRVMLGVGSGITKATYDLFGANPDESDEMSTEKLDAIIQLWSEKNIKLPERRYVPAMKDVTLVPRTYRDAPLPIYRACAREETAIDAGRRGQKLSLHTVSRGFELNKRFADVYRETYLAAGHDPKEMTVGVIIMTYCAPKDGKRAREHWHQYIDNYFETGAAIRAEKKARLKLTSPEESADVFNPLPQVGVFHSSHIGGTADDILEMIDDRYRQIGGWDELNCIFDNGGIPREEALESITCFGQEVIPQLQRRYGKEPEVGLTATETKTQTADQRT